MVEKNIDDFLGTKKKSIDDFLGTSNKTIDDFLADSSSAKDTPDIPIYKESDPSTWYAPTPEQEQIYKVGADPNAGYLQNMTESMLDPSEAAIMAATGGISGARHGLKEAGKRALSWGTYGGSDIAKGIGQFTKEALRNPKAIEKAIPIERVFPREKEAIEAATMAAKGATPLGVEAIGPTKPGKKAILKTEAEAMKEIPVEREGGFLKGLQRGIETPIRMFEKLDPTGAVKKAIYDPIDDADVAAIRELHDYYKPMIKRWKSTKVDADKIGTYMVSKQADGERILALMRKKIPELTEAEDRVVMEMNAEYARLFKRINDARRLAGKDPIGKVDNYFTFFKKLDWYKSKHGDDILNRPNPLATINEEFIHPNATSFKHAIARTRNNIPVETNAFDVFERYTGKTLEHIHLSPEIAKSRDLIATIEKTNPDAYKDITKWLDHVSGIRSSYIEKVTNKTVEKGIKVLNNNASMAVLAGNVRSALVQPTVLRNTLAIAKPKYTLEGIVATAFDPQRRKFIMDNSNIIARKFDATVSEFMSGLGKVKRGVTQATMKPLAWLDIQAAMASWDAFYRKAVNAYGMEHNAAVRWANDWTIKTNASGRAAHISPIQRSTEGKVLTALQTFVINDWSFLTQDVLGLGKNVPMSKENISRALWYIGGTIAVNSFFEDGLGINSPYGTPVRTFKKTRQAGGTMGESLGEAVKEAGDVMPILGQARFGPGDFAGVLYSTMKDLGSGSMKALGGDYASLIEPVSKLAGIPVTAQAGKYIRGREKGQSVPRSILGEVSGSRLEREKKKRTSTGWGTGW